MNINPEAQLAVKLYKHRNQSYPEPGDHKAASDAARLMSIARSLHRLYETYCNRSLTDREVSRTEHLEKASRALLQDWYGLACDHNRDPRGFSIYIHFTDGSCNSWGGSETGWGI